MVKALAYVIAEYSSLKGTSYFTLCHAQGTLQKRKQKDFRLKGEKECLQCSLLYVNYTSCYIHIAQQKETCTKLDLSPSHDSQ